MTDSKRKTNPYKQNIFVCTGTLVQVLCTLTDSPSLTGKIPSYFSGLWKTVPDVNQKNVTGPTRFLLELRRLRHVFCHPMCDDTDTY